MNAAHWILDATFRGLLLFAIAGTLAWLLRTRSASARHLVWTAAIIGQLALPLLEHVPFAWSPAVPITAFVFFSPSPFNTLNSPIEPPTQSAGALVPRPASSRYAAFQPAFQAVAVWRIAASLWLFGLGIGAVRVGLGTIRLRRWALRAKPMNDGVWLSMAKQVARELGIARPVTLLSGSPAGVPITWGVAYPVVLLPVQALEWTEDRRRMVLLHELVHVKRLDALTQFLAQIATTIFWFSPLVWLASRRMRTERERACDEAVLHLGIPPSQYASELLDIARLLNENVQPAFGALAAVDSLELEDRISAVLRPGPRPRQVGPITTCALAAWCLPAGLLLAQVHPLSTGVDHAKVNAAGASCTVREKGILDVTLGAPGPGQVANVGASSGGKAVLGVFDGNECLAVVISGAAVLADSLDEVSSLPSGGSLSLFDPRSAAGQRAEITERNGAVMHRYLLGASERPWSEGQPWFAKALARVVRDNGFEAARRVKTLRQRGGIDAVLEEAKRSRSEPGKLKLFTALAEGGPFNGVERERLTQAIGALRSTSDRKTVLDHIAGERGFK